ncbi:hypothetical protein SDC9_190895 [bioreactor metagenome]|uniref:Uncharacterized protein n=1 Tax=bioreactor metagenome TaxID=1076179 RepID=A0A645HXK4_9ZZZZ
MIVVWARRMRAGALENGAAEARISAAVGDQHRFHGGEFAGFVAGCGKFHVHRVPLGVVFEALLPRKLHFDRGFDMPCHQRRMVLYAHILLAAESAADEHAMAMHLLFGDAEHGRDLVLFVIDALRAAVEQDAILAFR